MFASRFCLMSALRLMMLAAPGCSTSAPAAAPIIIDGSSTVHPISEAAVADFRRASSLERPEVQQFVDFYARFAPDIAKRAGGVALRQRESELVLARLQKRVLGTMFATALKDDVSLERRLTQVQ